MQVWLNGAFVDHDAATVSVFDAGFQHAVGLFETLAVRGGRVFRGEQHMARLAGSASELRLTQRLRTDPLLEAVELTAGRAELSDARVRVTITGGNLGGRLEGGGPADPTILIVAQPPTPYPPRLFEEGVKAVIADGRVNPFDPTAGHKTLNYWARLQSLQLAAGKEAGEALWFSVTQHLAGGAVSNAFIVKDGALRTPVARGEELAGAIPSGVLPGITRACIIECAEAAGLAVERRYLDIEAVLAAEEIFLTNASWGVLPVVAVEAHTIGTGAVGPITKQLREAWIG